MVQTIWQVHEGSRLRSTGEAYTIIVCICAIFKMVHTSTYSYMLMIDCNKESSWDWHVEGSDE